MTPLEGTYRLAVEQTDSIVFSEHFRIEKKFYPPSPLYPYDPFTTPLDPTTTSPPTSSLPITLRTPTPRLRFKRLTDLSRLDRIDI